MLCIISLDGRSPTLQELIRLKSAVRHSIDRTNDDVFPGHLISPFAMAIWRTLTSTPYLFQLCTQLVISSKSLMLWDRPTSFHNKLRCSLPTLPDSIFRSIWKMQLQQITLYHPINGTHTHFKYTIKLLRYLLSNILRCWIELEANFYLQTIHNVNTEKPLILQISFL